MRLTMQKALAASGDKAGALAMARETALANANIALVALALGDALLATDQLPTAIGEFQRACGWTRSLNARARSLVRRGSPPEKHKKRLKPGTRLKTDRLWRRSHRRCRRGKISCWVAQRSALRASSVRPVFGKLRFAHDVGAPICAPSILRQLAEHLGLDRRGPQAILDLGAAQIEGIAVRDWANRLDGVDLSPAMIEKARSRAIYDELFVGDIRNWLATREYRIISGLRRRHARLSGRSRAAVGGRGPMSRA